MRFGKASAILCHNPWKTPVEPVKWTPAKLGFDKAALPKEEGGPASENASQKGFGHSGFTGTLVWADPETQIVYVFLSNRIHPDATNKKLLDMDVRTNIMEVIFNSVND